jgi:hypothetical protein
MFARLICSLVVLTGLLLGAAPSSAQESKELQSIIDRQIQAFRLDDGQTAFDFASTGLRSFFQSPERFMEMVRRSYDPVYRPERYSFGKSSLVTPGKPVQIVNIIDRQGRSWTAIYVFEQDSQGQWRIAGVSLEPIGGSNV